MGLLGEQRTNFGLRKWSELASQINVTGGAYQKVGYFNMMVSKLIR